MKKSSRVMRTLSTTTKPTMEIKDKDIVAATEYRMDVDDESGGGKHIDRSDDKLKI